MICSVRPNLPRNVEWSIAGFSVLFVCITAVGCGAQVKKVASKAKSKASAETKRVVEEPKTAPDVPSVAPSKPKPNPTEEFDALIQYINDNVAVRKAWFSMNEDNNLIFESPLFSKESFDDEGRMIMWEKDRPGRVGSMSYVELENYDWDESSRRGYLWWNQLSSGFVISYKITVSGGDAGLRVSKIEEASWSKKPLESLLPLESRAYKIKIIHYKPPSNLKVFWDDVLKNAIGESVN
jgi:hypothetical protein